AQALEESSLERLALDQRPLPTGPKHETRPQIERAIPTRERHAALRLLEQERVATTRSRATAERKLDQGERELTRLGFLARRRRAPSTRAGSPTEAPAGRGPLPSGSRVAARRRSS